MASKMIFLLVALFVVQCASGAHLKKRSIQDIPFIGPLINRTIAEAEGAANAFLTPLIQNLQNGISQAEGLIGSVSAAATQVINAATAPLQALVKGVSDKVKSVVDNAVQYGINSTACVFGQEEKARNITQQAAQNIAERVQNQVQPLVTLFADIMSLNNKGFGLARSIPGDSINCVLKGIFTIFPCILNNTKILSDQALLIASSLTQTIEEMVQLAVQVPPILAYSATDEISKATEKVGGIISDIGTCIKKVAENS